MTASQMQKLDRAARSRRRGAILPLVLSGIALTLLVATMAALIVRSQDAARARAESVLTARGAAAAGVAATAIADTHAAGNTAAAQSAIADTHAADNTAAAQSAIADTHAADNTAAAQSAIADTHAADNTAAAQSAIADRVARGLFAFLAAAYGTDRQAVYLVDAGGHLLASRPPVSAPTLAAAAPVLAAASQRAPSGTVTLDGRGTAYAAAPVAGTGWHVVIAVANSELYAGTSGATPWVPWLVFGIVALLAAGLWALFAGFLADRRRLARLSAEALELARTDPLTGLPNRRQLSDSLAQAMAHAVRYDEPLSVLMIDLDRFKQVNDTRGHESGDRVLRAVAACLREVLRDSDVYGRWGGDEFLAVLGHTPLDGAHEAAQRLCDCAGALRLWSAGLGDGVSLSIGCAAATGDLTEVLHTADAAMYEAKRSGRGGVAVALSRALR